MNFKILLIGLFVSSSAYALQSQFIETASTPACFMLQAESLQTTVEKLEDQAEIQCQGRHVLQKLEVVFDAPCAGANATATYGCSQQQSTRVDAVRCTRPSRHFDLQFHHNDECPSKLDASTKSDPGFGDYTWCVDRSSASFSAIQLGKEYTACAWVHSGVSFINIDSVIEN